MCCRCNSKEDVEIVKINKVDNWGCTWESYLRLCKKCRESI